MAKMKAMPMERFAEIIKDMEDVADSYEGQPEFADIQVERIRRGYIEGQLKTVLAELEHAQDSLAAALTGNESRSRHIDELHRQIEEKDTQLEHVKRACTRAQEKIQRIKGIVV